MARSNATMHARSGAVPKAGVLSLFFSIFLALVPGAKVDEPVSRRDQIAQRKQGLEKVAGFGEADGGFLEASGLLAIVIVIIVAVVALALLSALSPTFLQSVAGIVNVFSSGNYTTGDATADNVMPVFGTLIAFLGLFALVGLVFAAVQLRRGGA